MFERTHEQIQQLLDHKIASLDPATVEEDLTNFFERTELNIYAGDNRKISKAIRSSGLPIKKIKHERHGAWNPIVTVVTYTLSVDQPATSEEKTFRYAWR